MSPIVRRVIAGLGANAFGQGINVAIQILSLPLFLRRWDLATYGTWLMLSAIPAYLAMADVGMVTVAGNEMTMAMGRGDTQRANSLFQSISVLMVFVCGALAVVAVGLYLFLPLPGIEGSDERNALLALALGVLVGLFGGLFDSVFKATHRFALAVMLGNVTRIAEWVGGIAGLFVYGSFTAVAVGSTVARLVGVILTATLARQGLGSVFRWGYGGARRREIVSMLRPAASFMAFPLASALSLQGITLLTGQVLGPAAVALFNTYRTLARFAVQSTTIFSASLWPEFSRLYGKGGAVALANVYRRAVVLGAAIAVVPSVALFLLGPLILQKWTSGRVPFASDTVGILLAYAVAAGLWHVPRVLLIATNLHFRLAQWSLVTAAGVLALSVPMAKLWGLNGIALAMFVAEALQAWICMMLVRRIVHESPPNRSPGVSAVA